MFTIQFPMRILYAASLALALQIYHSPAAALDQPGLSAEPDVQLVAVAGFDQADSIVPESAHAVASSAFSLEELSRMTAENGFFRIFKKGGPIMIPLLIASILAMTAVIERLIFLLQIQRGRNNREKHEFLESVRKGDFERAINIGQKSRSYLVRAMGYGISHRDSSLMHASILFAQEMELKKFRKGIPLLDSVITLAPLLGLMGTVTGMMGSFSLIGGELSTPGAITGGIAEALIATAYGLGIAITALIPFNYLNTKMEKARLELEAAFAHLEILLKNNVEEAVILNTYKGSIDLTPSIPGISVARHPGMAVGIPAGDGTLREFSLET